ncbi:MULTISPECIES: hypothetical protein [unclassified Microcoleus]|uniref:hypothetical protein n=1 Tax=unclassified Microcoleus TaxID=2642155 RepID=UPI002FD51080
MKTYNEENLGRLAAESTLRSLVTQLLNSGMSREQVAQMMNLSTVEVRRLVGENFCSIALFQDIKNSAIELLDKMRTVNSQQLTINE